MNTITTSGGMRENPQIMLEIFRAVERRDAQRFAELVHPEFEIHWPPSLPYGGTYRDLEVDARQGRPTWAETWNPLQPTGAERRMDPRVVAVSDDGEETVVLWRQRGLSPAGERFDGPVLGLYRLRDGSSPARRCSTSIPWRWPVSWRRPSAKPPRSSPRPWTGELASARSRDSRRRLPFPRIPRRLAARAAGRKTSGHLGNPARQWRQPALGSSRRPLASGSWRMRRLGPRQRIACIRTRGCLRPSVRRSAGSTPATTIPRPCPACSPMNRLAFARAQRDRR
jgi:ketosteroid isomerase-like protein